MVDKLIYIPFPVDIKIFGLDTASLEQTNQKS